MKPRAQGAAGRGTTSQGTPAHACLPGACRAGVTQQLQRHVAGERSPRAGQRTSDEWLLEGMRAGAAAQVLNAFLLFAKSSPAGPLELLAAATKRACEGAAAAFERLNAASACDPRAAEAARVAAAELEHTLYLLGNTLPFMQYTLPPGSAMERMLIPQAVRSHLQSCARAARMFPGAGVRKLRRLASCGCRGILPCPARYHATLFAPAGDSCS